MNDEIESDFPKEELASDSNYIKHVRCEGAQFHVKSYHLINDKAVIKCSDPRCIINKPGC